MKKPKKKRRPGKLCPEDLHLAFANVRDPAAWAASIEHDAVADREWLRTHPKAKERVRSISPREMAALGHPSCTRVTVRRGPCGSQIRLFDVPDARVN